MLLEVRFHEGPLRGMVGQVDSLPQVQLFFDEKARKVLIYNRTDELVYTYERDMSEGATQKYDEFFERFKGNSQSVQKWSHNKNRSDSD